MILFLFALAIAVGAIYLIVQILSVPHIPERDLSAFLPKKREPVATAADPFVYSYEIKNISIPLTDKNRHRTAYAQFTLVLDCPTEECRHQMELNRAKLLDAIFEAALQFHMEDFIGQDGFGTLKHSLLGTFSTLFPEHAPRNLALQDWIMN